MTSTKLALVAAACGFLALPFAGGARAAYRAPGRRCITVQGAARACKVDRCAAPNRQDGETAVLSGGCFWGVQGVFENT